jgi:uncharacterized membrane protein
MEEGLKNRAYLEGLKLKKQGFEEEVIYARLEKQGIPEELAKEVAQNVSVQRKNEYNEEKEEALKVTNNQIIATIVVGIVASIVSFIFLPRFMIVIPIGFIIIRIIMHNQLNNKDDK